MGLGPEGFQFAHRREGQSWPVRRGQQPKLQRHGHGLVEGHAFGRCLEPTHLNATTIGTRNVAEGLGRVETLAPLTGQVALLGHEACAIEGSHGIGAVGCEEHPLPAGRIAIHGQLEEVGAFEEIRFAGGIALDDLGQAPTAEIGRVEEVDGVLLLPLHVEHHHPLPGGFMPHHLGVAITSGDFLQDRVARKLGELAAVGAVGDALHGGIAGSGVNEHERRFTVLAEAAGVLPVHHGAAAEHRSHVVGQELVSELLPMDEITTDGVAPVHVAPIPSVRIVLEEQVVLAVVEDHAVRIVVPTALWRKMELPAQRLAVHRSLILETVTLLDRRQRRGIGRQRVHTEGDGLSPPSRHVHGRPPVGRTIGQFDVVPDDGLAVHHQCHHALRGPVANGQVQIAGGHRDGSFNVLLETFRSGVGLPEVIDIEVSPTALGLVDDANGGRLPGQISDIPRIRSQGLAAATAIIRPRRRTDHLTLHQQL